MSQGRGQNIACCTYLIAAGANIPSIWGTPAETISRAFSRLATRAAAIPDVSPLFATPAFPAGAGPDFVNAAAALRSSLQPRELLTILHMIEAEAGRQRDIRWGQRTLDLDLLAADDQVLPDRDAYLYWRDLPLDRQMKEAPKTTILPHPRLQDRAFVLVPLAQVAPDWRHPVSGRTVRAMRDACAPADLSTVVRLGG